MRCEVRKTGHVNLILVLLMLTHKSAMKVYSLTWMTKHKTLLIIVHVVWPARCVYPRNLPWNPTQCYLRQLLLPMGISSPMVMRITARIKLTHLNLIIEHLNVLTMANDYVIVMLNYCVPNAQDFTSALFVTLVTFTKIMNDSSK